ncbi:hypothetical protein FKM82_006773 [Ascaphus truei]
MSLKEIPREVKENPLLFNTYKAWFRSGKMTQVRRDMALHLLFVKNMQFQGGKQAENPFSHWSSKVIRSIKDIIHEFDKTTGAYTFRQLKYDYNLQNMHIYRQDTRQIKYLVNYHKRKPITP